MDMDGCMDGWLDGYKMNEYKMDGHGWMDGYTWIKEGWMDGWIYHWGVKRWISNV